VIGRVHQRLLTLLEAEGFSAIEIQPARGHWRSSPYADVVRWEGYARLLRDCPRALPIYSWETMTECVRRGIQVSERDKGTAGMGYEIWPREAKPK